MTNQFKWIAGLIVLAGFLLGAYLVGVKTTEPTPEDVSPQAAQSLPGGAAVLERKPTTKPSKPKKPGTKVERDVSVTVKPDQPECEPATVDLQLVRDGEGRRVIASSPDGKVISGLDMPVEPAKFSESHPWAAGLSYGTDRSAGGWIERDIGRIRAGVDLIRQADGQAQARARVGWSW